MPIQRSSTSENQSKFKELRQQVILGQTVIQVAGHPVIFHVVDDSLLINQDGILGSEFFTECKARLDYERKHIKCGNIYILFDTKEKVIVPIRSSVPCTINITNPEINEGFIPKIEPIKVVYLGNASLSDRQGSSINRKTPINLRPHHKPSLINLQEPKSCKYFRFIARTYYNKFLGLLHVLTNYGESR